MPNDTANNIVDTIHQLEEDRIMSITQLTSLQLAYNEQMLELRKAKRLLKAAVEGFEFLGAWMDEYGECTLDCSGCPLHKPSYYCRGWNKQGEALALIGEEGDIE